MKFKLVGIGEVLWDLLPGERQVGGAPANFVYHARALGAEARLISRVGVDDLGRLLIERLQELGVPVDGVSLDPALPTGAVTVDVDAAGEPQFIIHESVAWDNLTVEHANCVAVSDADAVCFGTLAQRSEGSRLAIRSLLGAAPATAWRILDVNLRQHYYSRAMVEESLALANVLKVNESELPRLAELFGLQGDERAQMLQLAEGHSLRAVAYTRGAHGSLLLVEGHWSDHPGLTVEVRDTVGAGDSFTAAMTLGLLAGWKADQINRRANEVAAYVASCAGAMPPLPPELCAPFLAIRRD